MTTTLLEPELERFPNRYRWTVAQCYELAESGRLVGRYEVLDGEIINKMGQGPEHYFGINQFVHWANAIFGDRFSRIQGPIKLVSPDNIYSEPEPDIAITKEHSAVYAKRTPGPEDLLLVAEISDSSLPTDLLVKARLYARSGIVEYWVVNLTDRTLHIHREPKDGEYSVITVHGENESVSLVSRPNASVLISDLLPPLN